MISVIGGMVAGVITAVGILIVGTAIFWLYLFGDDPWPSWAERALVATAYVAGAAVFALVLFLSRNSRRR